MAIKLLQINTVGNFNATGRIAEEIGLTVMNQGWESYIAFGRYDRPSQSNKIRIGTDLDIKMHGLKSRLFDRQGFGSRSATLNLVERIKEIQPDIIQLHNLHGYYLNIEVLFDYLAGANIPVVWTFHDCWPFTGHCSHFEFVGCEKWKKGCFSCPQKNHYPASILMDQSNRNYKDKRRIFNSVSNLTIVSVSSWLNKLVGESFFKNFSQQTIYNGVNLSEFFPQKNILETKRKLGVQDRLMLLGVASVWDRLKGFDDFMKLSELVDKNTVIVLVGLNDMQLKKLPSNVIGISRTENISQLVEIYSAADLFVNLTYEDNFPTTNIESLACGTPVLTYRTGGSIEAVSQETGFIVDKGDLGSVVDAIKIVKEKGKSAFSGACRTRSEMLYNKDDRYMEYYDLYTSILAHF